MRYAGLKKVQPDEHCKQVKIWTDEIAENYACGNKNASDKVEHVVDRHKNLSCLYDYIVIYSSLQVVNRRYLLIYPHQEIGQ